MKVYYQSATNQIIDFLSDNYRLQTGDIFDYEWNYESVQSTDIGGLITKFTRKISSKELRLSVIASTREHFVELMNNLLSVTEKDVAELTPGKLYVNGYYLTCYIVKSEKTLWENGSRIIDVTLKLVSEYPFFIKEYETSYTEQTLDSRYGKFPMKYPWRYANGATTQQLINPHFTNSNFKLIIYGDCSNPSVLINGILYKVNVILLENERLEINTKARTIYLYRSDGTAVNVFASQDRTFYIFTPLQAGANTVSWDGTFAMDFVIFEERSEPQWQ